jgi:hypothetical protein
MKILVVITFGKGGASLYVEILWTRGAKTVENLRARIFFARKLRPTAPIRAVDGAFASRFA